MSFIPVSTSADNKIEAISSFFPGKPAVQIEETKNPNVRHLNINNDFSAHLHVIKGSLNKFA